MLALLKQLVGRTYHPLNRIEISRSALSHNYYHLSSLTESLVAPVLKSNAYGHGLVEVAKVVEDLHPPFVCVDSLFEAYELRKAGIKTPVLIMGYVNPGNLTLKPLPFWYAVFTREMLRAVAKYQRHAPIHIFVDTGMHREGVSLKDLPGFVAEAKSLGLKIEGLMSHLAKPQDPKNAGTRSQMKNFQQAKEIVAQAGVTLKWTHIGASSGLLNAKALGDIGNVARVGIALYGIDPEGKDKSLEPVLSLFTSIAQVKEIGKGDKVGYDFTYTAKGSQRLAVLPLGYNDGVDRGLSNRGLVTIAGEACPIVGRVSMNITLVDVSKLSATSAGEKVEVYSRLPQAPNSIHACASICQTIPYELLVHLNPFTRRVVVS